MSRKFELHVGFPENSETAAKDFVAQLNKEEKEGWSCSEVDAVYSESAEVDPHNVPGTLRYLISKSFSLRKDESDHDLLVEAQWVISTLANMDIKDARLEIESVFGYLTRRKKDGDGGASVSFSEPPRWSREDLQLQDGKFIDTPNSEIHFILEKDTERKGWETTPRISMQEAGRILSTYGVDVQQTIEYRSQKMIENRRTDQKLICTSYYDTPATARTIARRLFVSTRLSEDLQERGYTVRLVLERILGCYKPIHKTHRDIAEDRGIECALSHG
ncbi:MAG: hypothetical protein JWM21_3873 [Acidobacteria bacterium]|nr:hypothetical protein [Acidobacteriota bacterium]